jgi:hypothetical protein
MSSQTCAACGFPARKAILRTTHFSSTDKEDTCQRKKPEHCECRGLSECPPRSRILWQAL